MWGRWGVPVALLLAASPVLATTMPAATFSCQRLVAEKFDGAGPDDYLPSVLGTFTLDGKGGYVHPDGPGKVVLDKGLLHFTQGTLMGVVAAERTDTKGRTYLHIAKSITDPPATLPVQFDLVCYKN